MCYKITDRFDVKNAFRAIEKDLLKKYKPRIKEEVPKKSFGKPCRSLGGDVFVFQLGKKGISRTTKGEWNQYGLCN